MPSPTSRGAVFGVLGAAAALIVAAAAYLATRPGPELPPAAGPAAAPAARAPAPALAYTAQPIGDPVTGHPWIAHLCVVDLDGDGLPDVLVCDGQSNQLRWIRQSPRGVYTETTIGDVMGPAHVQPYDVYHSGRLDLLVASMGQIFPCNDRIGSIVIFENLGNGQFRKHVVAEHMDRVADVRGADLLGNGVTQLVAGCFGYDQGSSWWFENKGDWKFEGHIVNSQSGPVHTPVADYDGDGKVDFADLISQEWEEVHLFVNQGGGKFKDTIIWGSTNEDYGSSGLEVVDINRDGRPDLLYANGDAFDYARPGPRPWHGIQWLENKGGNQWVFHRVGDFPGAYGPSAGDLNGDGFIDLVAASGFNDWSNPNAVSLMAWLNDGHENFTPVVLAHSPTHLLVTAIADLDGDGVPEIITGGFHAYPPYDRMSRILLWKRH